MTASLERRAPVGPVGLKIGTGSETPRFHGLAMRLLEEPAFRSTEP